MTSTWVNSSLSARYPYIVYVPVFISSAGILPSSGEFSLSKVLHISQVWIGCQVMIILTSFSSSRFYNKHTINYINGAKFDYIKKYAYSDIQLYREIIPKTYFNYAKSIKWVAPSEYKFKLKSALESLDPIWFIN